MTDRVTDEQLAEWERLATIAPPYAPLVRALREARAEIERLNEAAEHTFPATWAGFRQFLDEFYPDDIFPDDGRDLGPAFVVAARRMDDLRGRLAAVEQLCGDCEAVTREQVGQLDPDLPSVLTTAEVRSALAAPTGQKASERE